MKSKMSLLIFCLALLAPVFYSLSYAQKAQKIDDKQKAFMEQKNLIDDSIASLGFQLDRLKYNLALDEQSYARDLETRLNLAKTGVRSQKIIEMSEETKKEIEATKAKIQEKESALRELRMKKGELKMKVVEAYGKLPEWWGTE